MSRGGVAPRVAQAAMRHSSIDLTMSVYTDPRLLDVDGAPMALPELYLDPSAEVASKRPRPAEPKAGALMGLTGSGS